MKIRLYTILEVILVLFMIGGLFTNDTNLIIYSGFGLIYFELNSFKRKNKVNL